MSVPRQSPAVDEIEALLRAGTYASTEAEKLRALFRAGSQEQAGRPLAPSLAEALRAYTKAQPDRFVALVDEDAGPMLIGPLVGDPCLTWPFDGSLALDDSARMRWLAVVEHAQLPTPAMIGLARTSLCSLRRQVWVPAARALGALATRSADVAQEVATLWRAVFDGPLQHVHSFGDAVGLPEHIPDKYRALQIVHLKRHLFVLACEVAGRTGRIAGHDPDVLVDIDAERMDDADLSAVVLGWNALLRSPLEAIRTQTAARLESLVTGEPRESAELTEGALRISADECRHVDASAAAVILALLTAPRWTRLAAAAQIDQVWSWIETGVWCHTSGRLGSVQAMRKVAGDLVPALDLALFGTLPRGAESAVEALEKSLSTIANPVMWKTTAPARRAAAVAEARLLLAQPDISQMPFDLLLRRAAPEALAPVGSASHEVALALLLYRHELYVETLLRDRELDEPVTLQLAAVQSGFVAKQLAVQAARLLGGRSPDAQLRFLWRLLQQNPPSDLLKKLSAAVPATSTQLRELIDALTALDSARDRRAPAAEIARFYGGVGGAAANLLGVQPVDGSAPPLRRLCETFLSLGGQQQGAGSKAWFEGVDLLLFGRQNDGLVDWLEWVADDGGAPRANAGRVREAWDDLVRAAAAARAAEPFVSQQQYQVLAEAIAALRSAVVLRSWPEELILETLLAELDGWHRAELERVTLRAETDAWMARLVDNPDEQQLRGALRGEQINGRSLRGESLGERLQLLQPDTIRRLHTYLLGALCVRDARQVRRAARGIVELPATAAYLAPLAAGAIAGIWLVLDVASGWTALAADWRNPRFLLAVGGAQLLSLLLLAGSLERSVGWRTSRHVRIRRAGRMLLVHAGAFALSTLSTLSVMWLLTGTDLVTRAYWSQAVLWSSLSQFLGLFLGLILQGRPVTAGGMRDS